MRALFRWFLTASGNQAELLKLLNIELYIKMAAPKLIGAAFSSTGYSVKSIEYFTNPPLDGPIYLILGY